MKNVTPAKIKNAYERLKRYAYYDSTNVFLRDQISNFEDLPNLDVKFHEIATAINLNDVDYFNSFEPSYWVLPKGLTDTGSKNKSKGRVIKNFPDDKIIEIHSVIKIINIAIEIHIVSILWILETGYKLVKDIKNNYGNMLVDSKILNKSTSKQLFKVYWGQYKDWRDNAIKEAKRLHNSDKNSVIIGLDIKNFYNSVDLDEKKLISLSGDDGFFLTNVLLTVYKKYSNQTIAGKIKRICLPIGILSSPVLANWYLKSFDVAVYEKLQPLYYGRYVDDILCVFNHNSLSEFKTDNEIIEFFFKKELIKTRAEFKVSAVRGLSIQQEKLSIMLFDYTAPLSLLEKFEKEIRKSSSEFRLIQQKFTLEQEFNTSSLRIIYDGSVNKLRSIKEFDNDKFGIASFLTKANYVALNCAAFRENIKKDILRFFVGRYAIEYFTLWEKAFAYFVISNDRKSFNELVENILKSILKITCTQKIISADKIQDFLFQYLKILIIYAISIRNDIKFIADEKVDIYEKIGITDSSQIETRIKSIHKSRMLNDKYIRFSFSQLLEDNLTNCIKPSIANFEKIGNINQLAQKMPRFISLYEKQTIKFLNNLYLFSQKQSYEISDFMDKFDNKSIEFKKAEHISEIIIGRKRENDFLNRFKIGIANLEIAAKIFSNEHLRMVKGDPFYIDYSWLEKILEIIDQAVKAKVKMLVLPECAIPLGAIDVLIDKAKKEQMVMVFGLQHIITENNYAFNIQVTVLPFEDNGRTDVYVD